MGVSCRFDSLASFQHPVQRQEDRDPQRISVLAAILSPISTCGTEEKGREAVSFGVELVSLLHLCRLLSGPFRIIGHASPRGETSLRELYLQRSSSHAGRSSRSRSVVTLPLLPPFSPCLTPFALLHPLL